MKTRLFETFFVECKPLSAGVCWQKPDMLHLLSCPGTLQVRPCCRRVLLAISAVSVEGKSILEWILDTCVCIYTCISCTCLCLGAGMVQKDMLITSSLIYLGWIRDSMVLWLWLGPRASPKKDISFHPMKSHWVFDKEATLELASNNTHHAIILPPHSCFTDNLASIPPSPRSSSWSSFISMPARRKRQGSCACRCCHSRSISCVKEGHSILQKKDSSMIDLHHGHCHP